MEKWLRVSSRIDGFSDRVGQLAYWLCLFMVLLAAFNAIGRYSGRTLGVDLVGNALIESQWYLFGFVVMLGSSYALRHNAHVRVDLFYSRLSPKGHAWINLFGSLLFLFPFCLFMIRLSWPATHNAWLVKEVSPDPGGLLRFPIKAAVPLGFFLLLIQGVSELIKQIAVIRGYQLVEEAAPTEVL